MWGFLCHPPETFGRCEAGPPGAERLDGSRQGHAGSMGKLRPRRGEAPRTVLTCGWVDRPAGGQSGAARPRTWLSRPHARPLSGLRVWPETGSCRLSCWPDGGLQEDQAVGAPGNSGGVRSVFRAELRCRAFRGQSLATRKGSWGGRAQRRAGVCTSRACTGCAPQSGDPHPQPALTPHRPWALGRQWSQVLPMACALQASVVQSLSPVPSVLRPCSPRPALTSLLCGGGVMGLVPGLAAQERPGSVGDGAQGRRSLPTWVSQVLAALPQACWRPQGSQPIIP